jgi:hypothetical protein
MSIPVPIRKFLIQRWNKQKEIENKDKGHEDPNQPLSRNERNKFLKKNLKTPSSK